MYDKFRASLRAVGIRLMVWFRLRVLCRSKVADEQYKAIVEAFVKHPETAHELLYSAQFIAKIARFDEEHRDTATMQLGASMLTGMFAHELATTGDETLAKGTLNLARCFSVVPEIGPKGVLGLGFGTSLRTMELIAIVRAAAIGAALLANDDEAHPQRFLEFVAGGMAGEEQWAKVRDSIRGLTEAAKRVEDEGGSISEEQIAELEEIFNLNDDATA